MKWLSILGLVGGASGCIDFNPVKCVETRIVYAGSKTGPLWTQILNPSGGVESADGTPGGVARLPDGGSGLGDCWGPGGITSGQVIAWIDATGAEESNCIANPKGLLCAPRLCDPQGRTPFELNGAQTMVTITLTDPDAGCP
jgi:hypothetical protein